MLHAVVPFKSGIKSVTGITEPAQSEQHPSVRSPVNKQGQVTALCQYFVIPLLLHC